MQLEFADEGRGGSVYLMAEFLLDVMVLSASLKQNLLGRAALPFYRGIICWYSALTLSEVCLWLWLHSIHDVNPHNYSKNNVCVFVCSLTIPLYECRSRTACPYNKVRWPPPWAVWARQNDIDNRKRTKQQSYRRHKVTQIEKQLETSKQRYQLTPDTEIPRTDVDRKKWPAAPFKTTKHFTVIDPSHPVTAYIIVFYKGALWKSIYHYHINIPSCCYNYHHACLCNEMIITNMIWASRLN